MGVQALKMIKVRHFIFLFTLLSYNALGQLKGDLERISSFPSEFIVDRRVDIWTPKGAEGPFKVLLMHDGQMLFQSDSAWNGQEWGIDESLDSLYKLDQIGEVMVVAVWNVYRHRHRNYFPQKPFENLSQAEQDTLLNIKRPGQENLLFSAAPNSDDYLKFFFKELIPYIKDRYPIQKKELYMLGSSMGGLISLYAAMEYPKELKGVACLSTHWPGIFVNDGNPIPDAFLKYLEQNEKAAKKTKWYFDRGDATLDAMYPIHQDRVDLLFKNWELDSDQFQSLVFPGAPHEETAWRKRIPQIVLYLLESE